MAPYDPDPSAEDFQDTQELAQTGLTPALTPATSLRQTAPGVYSPAPPPSTAPPPSGLSRIAPPRPRWVPNQDAEPDTGVQLQYSQPAPAPKEEGGTLNNLWQYGLSELDRWHGNLVEGGRFLNDQLGATPEASQAKDDYAKSLIASSVQRLEKMTPNARRGALASAWNILGYDQDKDEQGNPLPSPLESPAVLGNYIAQKAISLGAPLAAIAALAYGGAAAVGGAAVVGGAAGISMLVSGLLFGVSGAGETYQKLSNDVAAIKPGENQTLDQLLSSGMSLQDARAKMLATATASVWGSLGVNAVAGVGLGHLTSGPISQIERFFMRRLAGAAEAGGVMAGQAGGTNLAEQTGEQKLGLQTDIDTAAAAKAALQGGAGGAVLGFMAGGRKAPSKAEPPPPTITSDPAAAAAVTDALAKPAAPPPAPPPPPVTDPNAPGQGMLAGTSPQGEMYTGAEAGAGQAPRQPIITGVTPGMKEGATQGDLLDPNLQVSQTPPPVQGEMFPRQPPPTPIPPAAETTSAAPAASMLAKMKKPDLVDDLVATGVITRQQGNRMSVPDLRARWDQHIGSTVAPESTTVVEGAIPGRAAPSAADSEAGTPGPDKTAVAPPASEASLPSTPAGAAAKPDLLLSQPSGPKQQIAANELKVGDRISSGKLFAVVHTITPKTDGSFDVTIQDEHGAKTTTNLGSEAKITIRRPGEEGATKIGETPAAPKAEPGTPADVDINRLRATHEAAKQALKDAVVANAHNNSYENIQKQKDAQAAWLAASRAYHDALDARDAAEAHKVLSKPVEPKAETAAAAPKGKLTASPKTAEALAAAKEKTVGVAPEKGGPKAHVEGAEAAPEVTPEVKAAQDAALKKLDAAHDEYLKGLPVAIEVKPGSVHEHLKDAWEQLKHDIGMSDGSPADLLQIIDAAKKQAEPGENVAAVNARRVLARKLEDQLAGKKPEPPGAAKAKAAAAKVAAKRAEVEAEFSEGQRAQAGAGEAKTAEAIEERATGGGEGESAGQTMALEPTQAKITKASDAKRISGDWIKKVLDPSDPTTVQKAEEEYAKTTARGQPRRKEYATIAAALDTEIARVDKPAVLKKAQADLERLANAALHTKEGTAARTTELNNRVTQLEKLREKVADFEPERVARLKEERAKLADPVKAAADASVEARAKLEEKMAGRTGKPSEMHIGEAPRPDGIPSSSSRYVRISRDPRLETNFVRALHTAQQHNGNMPLHDALRLVHQDPMVNAEAQPFKMLATQLLKLAPNIPVMTRERVFALGLISKAEYERTAGGYGAMYPDVFGKPKFIMINTAAEHLHGSHLGTLMHEAMHSVTQDLLNTLLMVAKGHPIIKALKAIHSELIDHYTIALNRGEFKGIERENLAYALSDLHELHTMLMSDPTTQAFVASRIASPKLIAALKKAGFAPRDMGTSVWRYFTDWVRQALGLKTPATVSEYTLLDHLLRPMTDITTEGRAHLETIMPRDPRLRETAAPMWRATAQGFSPQTQELTERALDRIDVGGRSAGFTRAMLSTMPFDRMVDRHERLAPTQLRAIRAAIEKGQTVTAKFLNQFRDDTQRVVRALRGQDDVAELMDNAGYAQAALGRNVDPERNSHLTTPEQQTELAALQKRFDAMSPAKQELYENTRTLLTQKYLREREAIANNLVNRFLPNASDADKKTMLDALSTKEKLDAFLKDPANAGIAEQHQVIARGIATLHRMGFVNGDYFPMRRYGDYIVEYGGAPDDPGYGMQAFESMREAEAFRRSRPDAQAVRERDSIIQKRARPASPVIAEMLDRVAKDSNLKDHATELEQMVTKLQLQYASNAERARARRRRVAGASKDIARAIQTDMATSALRVGALEHAGERDQAMRDLEYHRDAMARAGDKSAFTLDQVHHELQRRFEIGDSINYGGASGLARKLTAFGYAHTLVSWSRLATETAEMHLKMGAFIGARYGMGRASIELGRALKDISPKLWGKGMANTAKAFIGKPLSSVDYNLSEMAHQRLNDKYSRSETDPFFKHFEENGLFENTTAHGLKELARSTNIGGMFNWFMDVTGAMSHASDVSNRIAGTWAAYRLGLARGESIPDALRFAEDTLRKAPNFSPANKPRIATDKGVFGKFSAPIMQFKLYGLNEGWTLANLARDVMSKATDPKVRKEAAYALAGTIMSHTMMAGLLTWYADPARYIGGAYDLLTGQKPQDRMFAARKWLHDTIGPTWGDLVGMGMPRAAGIDTSLRLGINNMFNIPSLNGLSAKDLATFAGQLVLGAPGGDISSIGAGLEKAINGDILGGAKDILPRMFRDPLKAYEYATEGVKDSRGKHIMKPEEISARDITVQALGFTPADVEHKRANRNAVLQAEQYQKDWHDKLTNAWVEADPADRPAVWAKIKSTYNADPDNKGAHIDLGKLHALLNQRRKDEKADTLGLRLPKKSAPTLMGAAAF